MHTLPEFLIQPSKRSRQCEIAGIRGHDGWYDGGGSSSDAYDNVASMEGEGSTTTIIPPDKLVYSKTG